MTKHFLNLERKQFFRSSYWQKSLALNIILVFLGLYFIILFLGFGFGLLFLVKKLFPGEDAFIVVNGFLFYWFLGDLLFRFFLQKLPVMSVKPLLTLPIKRSKIVHFVLKKSVFSFFNVLPLFAIIPFGIMLLANGYEVSLIITWIAALLITILIINFLNFIIEALSAESELSFLPIIVIAGLLFGLDYFNLISIKSLIGNAYLTMANHPVYFLLPFAVLALIYSVNYKILAQKLYLDASLTNKVKEVKTADLSWTNKFGALAPFLQLDLKLIWRNKRTKSMLPLTLLVLFYGIYFYTQPNYQNQPVWFAFVGIFITGIFLINFGQFIPAWDSAYYKLLMSQNLKYERYLRSKFILMNLSVGILFVLSIPYVYFGYKIILAHFAAAVYNIGVNAHIMLYGGSFNRKRIDLNKRAAFNYQGTGAVQWIIGLPLMLIPMAIFGIAYWLINFEFAVAILTGLGVLGIVLHQKIMKHITQRYANSKHQMIDAFSKVN